MADWTEINSDDLLPGEPLTSAKANAFYENPIALAEGAPGAPRNVPASLAIHLGSGSITADSDQTIILASPSNTGFVLLQAEMTITTPSSGTNTGSIFLETSTDGGASWLSPSLVLTSGILSTSGTSAFSGKTLEVFATTGANAFRVRFEETGNLAGTASAIVFGLGQAAT